MSEFSFPFDAVETSEGGYDREYIAEDFARYFRAFISSGVFLKESTNLQVIANGDMTVTLKPGNIIIDGYRYELTDDLTFTLEPADGVLSRITRISLTWGREDRNISAIMRDGALSYNPTAPECRRNADHKDYVVADILVSAGSASITQADITDQRLNTEVCGLAIAFSEIDTTTIFNQFMSWMQNTQNALDAWETEEKADFDAWQDMEASDFETWFNSIKDILDDETAGHLLNLINDIRDHATDITQRRITSFPEDGSIVEALADGRKVTTTFPDNGSIVETATDASNEVLWTKTTSFNDDGSIKEEIIYG